MVAVDVEDAFGVVEPLAHATHAPRLARVVLGGPELEAVVGEDEQRRVGIRCLQEVADIPDIHAAGRHNSQVGQGSANGFDVARAQRIRRKDLDKIRAGFVSRLSFGRSVSA